MGEVRQHKNPDTIWLFDYNSLASMDDCAEFMVWLSERDINLIWQAVLNIERFRSRVFTAKNGDNYTIADLDQFGNFKEWVSDMNVHLGDYLMCNQLMQGMVKSNLLLVAAITGQSIDLNLDAEGLETYLNGAFDFSATGLANRIGPEVVASDAATIQATMERLKVVAEELKALTEASPHKDLEPVLIAIEHILGGDWEPPAP